MDRIATIEDLKTNYQKVKYRATDGKFYSLDQYYPIHMTIKDRPDFIYLDTGGPMTGCYFACLTVKKGKLFEEDIETRELVQVSPRLIVEEE